MNRKQYITEKVKEQNQIDKVQSYLDYVGLIPGVGDVVDVGSALVDVLQGQYKDAAFRGAAALPIVGSAIGASKPLKFGLQTVGFGAPFIRGMTDAAADDKKTKTPDDANIEQEIRKQQKKEKEGKAAPQSDIANFADLYNKRVISNPQFSYFKESLNETTAMLIEIKTIRDLGAALGAKFRKPKDAKTPDTPDVDPMKVQIVEPPKTPPSRTTRFMRAVTPANPQNVKKALGLTVPGTALTAAALAIPAIPSLLGSIYGDKGGDKAGAPLTPGIEPSAGGGMGALGAAFDRLTPALGYIPGNPAAVAMQSLGRRAGVA